MTIPKEAVIPLIVEVDRFKQITPVACSEDFLTKLCEKVVGEGMKGGLYLDLSKQTYRNLLKCLNLLKLPVGRKVEIDVDRETLLSEWQACLVRLLRENLSGE